MVAVYIRGKDRPRILIYVDTINGMVEHVLPDGVSFEVEYIDVSPAILDIFPSLVCLPDIFETTAMKYGINEMVCDMNITESHDTRWNSLRL